MRGRLTRTRHNRPKALEPAMFKFVPLVAAAGVVALASGIYPSASAATPRVTTIDAPTTHPATSATYRNPLALKLPDGDQAQSCADPTAIHGQQRGDTNWYLYCTSDVLSTNEKSPSGGTVLHNLPTYRSSDLTHWSYVGDALPTKPSWVAASGNLWAPDVVYRDGHYLLYYAASDTSLLGAGAAIGVASSDSPTGPWTDSGAPVVAPENVPGGGRRGLLDPEVITDGAASYIYYGGFYGGVSVRQLSADGLTSLPQTEQQIAIDNRYEGTFITKHDGWYYFMGSATNCCNGPLTGYTVFAARSRSPLGPFVDRDGVSILDSRVGGTPVLAQNGNRWVGTGHNTMVTDYSGQDWMIYHAVDRTDPYYAGAVGYTKRPGLIDPLDWRDGWPTIRGGRGPSDSPIQGPAAQPDQVTHYSPRFVTDPQPGATVRGASDDFNGTNLSPQWSWVRQPSASSYSIAGGQLQWQTQPGDLHPPSTPLASVLIEPAPRGDYVLETKVKVSFPTDGWCCQNYAQGGLVVYGDDGHYVKLVSVSIWNTRQTEFGKEVYPAPAGYPNYGNAVVGPVGDWTYLRIVRRLDNNGDTYTAYSSLDARHWDKGATWTQDLGSTPRIGLVSMGSPGFTSSFDYVHVSHPTR